MVEPPPKAPRAATLTCQASPADSSWPSHSTWVPTGSARRPATSAPAAWPSAPSGVFRRRRCERPVPAARCSPRSRTGADGSPRRRLHPAELERAQPGATHRQAASRRLLVGRPSRRAKSLAVPAGITAAARRPRRRRRPRGDASVAARTTAVRLGGEGGRHVLDGVQLGAERAQPAGKELGSRPDSALATSAICAAPVVASVRIVPDPTCSLLAHACPRVRFATHRRLPIARVFVSRRLPGGALERLAAAHEVEVARAHASIARGAAGSRPELDGLLAMLTDRVDAELIAAAPRLRAISNYAVGTDNVDLDAASARGIPVGQHAGGAHRRDCRPALALMLGDRAGSPRARPTSGRATGAPGSPG